MIFTSSNNQHAIVTIYIAGKQVAFFRACADGVDAAVIADAAQKSINADRNDLADRYRERTEDFGQAMRRISALKARITKLKNARTP